MSERRGRGRSRSRSRSPQRRGVAQTSRVRTLVKGPKKASLERRFLSHVVEVFAVIIMVLMFGQDGVIAAGVLALLWFLLAGNTFGMSLFGLVVWDTTSNTKATTSKVVLREILHTAFMSTTVLQVASIAYVLLTSEEMFHDQLLKTIVVLDSAQVKDNGKE